MSAVSDTPMRTVPTTSSRTPGWVTVRGRDRNAAANVTTPIGTLMRNTRRQPTPHRSHSMRPPASTGAGSIDSPIIGPKALKTFASSSSAKVSFSIPKPCGIISAPKPPCSTRKPMSSPVDGATAHAAENTVKPAEPIRNSLRRPNRSPSRALVTSMTASASV